MEIRRRIERFSRKMSFKRLKEALEKTLNDEIKNSIALIDNLRDLKNDFVRALPLIFNPYSSDISGIYDVKEDIEELKDIMKFELMNTFVTLPLLSLLSFNFLRKGKHSTEDIAKAIEDPIRLCFRMNFYREKVLNGFEDIISIAEETVNEVLRIVERIGDIKGLLKDKYKGLAQKIKEFERRFEEFKVIVRKSIMEAEMKALAYLNPEPEPKILVENILRDFLSLDIPKAVPEDIKRECERVKEKIIDEFV